MPEQPTVKNIVHAGTGEPVVSIVIVTYNAVEYVRRCLESIHRHSHVPYEVLVIDNASQAETREFLRSQTGIRLFLNEDNLLWSGGCNQGMREAHPASRYLLLLNPDTEVLRSDWLEVMIRHMESDPQIGIVGTQHHYRDAGPIYGWLDGQCFMIRREVIESIGYLDAERFPMGGAPQLFTIKAFKAGWSYKRVHQKSRLIVHHKAKSRDEIEGEKPWKPGRPNFEQLMREEGMEPVIAPPLVRYLRRRLYRQYVRTRFFYAPPA